MRASTERDRVVRAVVHRGRLVSEEERRRADRLLRRWGVLAIVVTSPVPILVEATAVVAGTSSLGWSPPLGAARVGSLPAALLYAVAGALAASFATGAVVFAMFASRRR